MSEGASIGMLYEALGSPDGVVIATSDPVRLRQRLYTLRREANDPDLETLSIVASPTSQNELWIVKRPKP